ncbi:MAG: CPBP family intramembrane glutamic endopeptidase [Polyangiales bacterium]
MSEAPKPAPPPQVGSQRNSSIMWTRIRKRPHPMISVAFTVPVFVLYHLGVLAVQEQSQVDFVSTVVLKLVETSTPAYVMFTLALSLVLLLTTWWQQKKGKIAESPHKRVAWEALGGAVFAVAALGYANSAILHGEASAISAIRIFDKIVVSLGSGFHEELVFRALLISGGIYVLNKLKVKLKPWMAIGLCMIVSSVLFSLVHYFAIYDEPFAWSTAVYRALEGLFFATLYVTRGFAVAVYAHVFYNLITVFLPF